MAHMGIESGNPTKAEEYKSKTSKEIDLWLCDELTYRDLGSVVHYDPRVGWSSDKAARHTMTNTSSLIPRKANENDWLQKLEHIEKVRKPQLKMLAGIDQFPKKDRLRAKFFKRSEEYLTEDYNYRQGDYAPYTTFSGPFIRLKVRQSDNMFGDHDLFGFTYMSDYGLLASLNMSSIANIQRALQQAFNFQAQHGGIWYWRPEEPSRVRIKNIIMMAHYPNGNEPLVYIQPNKQITAAYFIGGNRLESVWKESSWTKWMETTGTGKLYLKYKAKIEVKKPKKSGCWWDWDCF
ncbi:MAG: hypothetical protein GY750_06800 [Lentisphaerae bacterium]|nr:hypothetical protein [Lentisphaerota bacterium]